MPTKLTPEQKKANRSWTYSLTIFWVSLVSMTVYFVYVAVNSQSELVAEDYYEQGVTYQNTIDQRKAFFSAFGNAQPKWQAKQFQFNTQVPNIQDMRAKLYRPSDQTKDQMVSFGYSESDSLWLTPTLDLISGPWNMTLRIVIGKDTTQQTFKQFIP